jgi:hypothetical protein
MPTGRENQLTKGIGEHLVCSELCRMGFIATTFTGNVPYFDILASTEDHRAVHVQVKAIKTGDWQPGAGPYLHIDKRDGHQKLLGIRKLPKTVCVFVRLRKLGEDEFYIFWMRDLQRILYRKYKALIARTGGVRRHNPTSTHETVRVKDISRYEDNWKLLEDLLRPRRSD